MKKILNLEIDIRVRMFYAMALAACIANSFGFIANFLIYGMTVPTIICGVCALLMFTLNGVGNATGHIAQAVNSMLFLLVLFEFPFLYYVYGKGTIVYMVLGIVAIAVFTNGRKRYLCGILAIVYDTVVMIISYLYPSQIEEITEANTVGSTVCSYVIVTVTIFSVLLMLSLQYEWQNQKLQLAGEELQKMVNRDPLTGIYNRRYLTNYLDEKMREPTQNFGVILLDLDDFKSINDRFGHVFGDEVLICFAGLMKKALGEYGIVARFGGEEFMMVLETTDQVLMEKILEEIRLGFLEFSKERKGECFTFSGGAEIFHPEDKITQLFNAADEKLYMAKSRGKNQIVFR